MKKILLYINEQIAEKIIKQGQNRCPINIGKYFLLTYSICVIMCYVILSNDGMD